MLDFVTEPSEVDLDLVRFYRDMNIHDARLEAVSLASPDGRKILEIAAYMLRDGHQALLDKAVNQ